MDLIKSRTEATGMSEQEIAEFWRLMPESPYRKIFEYELKVRTEQETTKLQSDLTFDQYHKQKGVIEGIKIALGILSRNDKVNTKKS